MPWVRSATRCSCWPRPTSAWTPWPAATKRSGGRQGRRHGGPGRLSGMPRLVAALLAGAVVAWAVSSCGSDGSGTVASQAQGAASTAAAERGQATTSSGTEDSRDGTTTATGTDQGAAEPKAEPAEPKAKSATTTTTTETKTVTQDAKTKTVPSPPRRPDGDRHPACADQHLQHRDGRSDLDGSGERRRWRRPALVGLAADRAGRRRDRVRPVRPRPSPTSRGGSGRWRPAPAGVGRRRRGERGSRGATRRPSRRTAHARPLTSRPLRSDGPARSCAACHETLREPLSGAWAALRRRGFTAGRLLVDTRPRPRGARRDVTERSPFTASRACSAPGGQSGGPLNSIIRPRRLAAAALLLALGGASACLGSANADDRTATTRRAGSRAPRRTRGRRRAPGRAAWSSARATAPSRRTWSSS